MSAYDYERDEWRRAVAHSTEAELAAACGHTSRQHGVCTDCGHRPDREDL